MLGMVFSMIGLLFCIFESWVIVVVGGGIVLVGFFFISGSFNFLTKISLWMGLDLLGVVMIILSFWIMNMMVVASEKKEGGSSDLGFSFLLILLAVLLLLSFSVGDGLLFYVFFECALIPIFVMVVGYGYQPERLMAGLYMFFYTLFASLPLLLGLMKLYKVWGSLCFYVMVLGGWGVGEWWSWMLVGAFLVSLPMFMVHLWLPKAHVEAPVGGSMILAGVLLSLGGYGLYRFAGVLSEFLIFYGGYFVGVGLLGGVVVGFICLGQIDLSSLIAYSSVGHMGLVLAGVMSLSYFGFQGGFMMMVAHGLCSSGLFCLANIVYERIYSRSLLIISGLLGLSPGLALWWFLLGVSNMAAPPSLNMFSEVMIVVGVVKYLWWVLVVLLVVMFMAGAYSLWMYACVNHGDGWLGLFLGGSVNEREYLLVFCHWLPLNGLVLKMDVVSLWVF